MKNRITDINEATINEFVQKLRPQDPEIRKQIDFGYFYGNRVVELFEIRPRWDKPDEKLKIPFARIKFYKSKNLWSLYWKRASDKWELYEPFPNATHLSQILEVIDKDSYGCFNG